MEHGLARGLGAWVTCYPCLPLAGKLLNHTTLSFSSDWAAQTTEMYALTVLDAASHILRS